MRALLLAAALLLAGCTGGPAPVSGEVKAWSFTDTDGATHSGESSKGEPTLLFFMATWCSKCQTTAPRLTQLHHEFMGKPLHLYTLSHDPTEDSSDLTMWKSKYNQMWPHGVDQGSATAKTFGITKQSSIVVFNKDGEEFRKWIYATPSLDELRSAVNEASV